jgi:tetratricopeptide (TPR) repeat protein
MTYVDLVRASPDKNYILDKFSLEFMKNSNIVNSKVRIRLSVFIVSIVSATLLFTSLVLPSLASAEAATTPVDKPTQQMTSKSGLESNKTKVPAISDAVKSNNQAIALLKSGKYNESIPYFDKALSISPGSFSGLYYKAAALFALRHYNESIPYFDKALSINPNSVGALNGKGVALDKLGRYNESIPYFDKALSINSSSIIASKYKMLALAASHGKK